MDTRGHGSPAAAGTVAMDAKLGRPSLMPNTQSESLSVRFPVPVFDAITRRAVELQTTPRELVRQAVNFVLKNGVTFPEAPQ